MPDGQSGSDSDALTVYALRYTSRARGELVHAVAYLADTVGEELAGRWYADIRTAIGTLATLPHRYHVLARESRLLGHEVRRMLFQSAPRSGIAYHIYYHVEDAGGTDGPQIEIVHVRHAARRPLTPREAHELRSETDS